MKVKKTQLIFFLLILIGNLAFAQSSLVIDGDTIRVCDDFASTIMFPGLIHSAEIVGPKGDYITTTKKSGANGKLSIKTGSDNPMTSCLLLVDEGDIDNPRQHKFVVYHASKLDPSEAILDFSNMGVMNARKEQLAQQKKKNKGRVVKEEPVPEQKETPEPAKSQPAQGDDAEFITLGTTKIKRTQLDKNVVDAINKLKVILEALGNHKAPVDAIVPEGMKLFNNDKSKIVEVTKKSGKSQFKIMDYMKNIYKLTYFKTNITYSKLQFISNFRRDPDGLYRGTVSMEQTFTGSNREGRVTYSDVTRKTYQIIIEVTSIFKDGVSKEAIRIFLGDIGVSEDR